jgi:menaquinone-specific isochorismate synthase
VNFPTAIDAMPQQSLIDPVHASDPTPESSIAFMDLPDGRTLVGHGPFLLSTNPPESGVAFYINDFGLNSPQPWHIPQRWELLNRGELAGRITEDVPACSWKAPDATDFATVFQEITASILSGTFEKTVPVVVEHGHFSEAPGLSLLRHSADAPVSTAGYGYICGDHGFTGTSPEWLLQKEGHLLKTMALAGTARSEEREVLAADEKEIREHEYVAQSLVAKLGDLGHVRRGPRQLLELGSIVHFHTPIEVDLSETISPESLIRRLHPTPALGPLPRTPDTLKQLLGWRERLGTPPGFGAPFGVWLEHSLHVLISIRGVWWDKKDISLPAGCGVIEASRLVNEWRELRLKREAVKSRLRII